jgi:phosphoribosylanthranilate isomerase
MIQLHGNEHPDICRKLMPHTIKAFRIKDELSLESVKGYYGTVRAFLFDTYSEEREGGTGKPFDWDLAIKAKGLGAPIILSGGLSPSNIRRAITTVGPYAVDVNSGIEEFPGKKDPLLMKTLMKKIEMKNSGGLLDD